MLQVKGLSKKFLNGEGVENLNFHINDGEIVGLVGPNGSGKSTTLKTIVGLYDLQKGSLTLDGLDRIQNEIDFKRKVSYVPEMPILYDDLTVMEHLKFIAMAYGVDKVDFETKAKNLLTKFKLFNRRDEIPADFSKGMMQKVCIACAFIHDPSLILVDEPFIGLDPRSIRDLVDTLKENRENGNKILISSHVLTAVEGLCDRFIILKKGRILAQGSIEEIKAQFHYPADFSFEELFLNVTENED